MRASSRTTLAFCAALAGGAAHADDAASVAEEPAIEVITVVGSHIAGGGAAEAVSVATVDQAEIESIGATNATHRWALSVKKAFSAGWLEGSAIELGSRNLFDEEPPLGATPASTGSNYLSSLHESFGRYLYLDVSKNW